MRVKVVFAVADVISSYTSPRLPDAVHNALQRTAGFFFFLVEACRLQARVCYEGLARNDGAKVRVTAGMGDAGWVSRWRAVASIQRAAIEGEVGGGMCSSLQPGAVGGHCTLLSPPPTRPISARLNARNARLYAIQG